MIAAMVEETGKP